MTTAVEQTEQLTSVPRRPGRLRRLRESPVLTNRQSLAGITILALIILTALIGPLFLHGDVQAKVGPVFAPPSHRFWLGTDMSGRDIAAQIFHGARVSLLIGFVATVGMIAQ